MFLVRGKNILQFDNENQNHKKLKGYWWSSTCLSSIIYEKYLILRKMFERKKDKYFKIGR